MEGKVGKDTFKSLIFVTKSDAFVTRMGGGGIKGVVNILMETVTIVRTNKNKSYLFLFQGQNKLSANYLVVSDTDGSLIVALINY